MNRPDHSTDKNQKESDLETGHGHGTDQATGSVAERSLSSSATVNRPDQSTDNNQKESDLETGHGHGTDQSTAPVADTKGFIASQAAGRTHSTDDNPNEIEMETGHGGGTDSVNSNGEEVRTNNESQPLTASALEIVESPTILYPGYLAILCNLVGIIMFAVDLCTDCNLAYRYYLDGQTWWFGLTVLFVLLPMVIMTLYNFGLYFVEKSFLDEDLDPEERMPLLKVSFVQWFLRIVFTMLMLGPFIRMLETPLYAWRFKRLESTNHPKDVKCKVQERFKHTEWASSLIGLMEAFMEAAPQLVLQLSILVLTGWTEDNTQLGEEPSLCDPNPCKNSGNCSVLEDKSGFECDCPAGRTGPICDSTNLHFSQLLSVISSACLLSWALLRFKKVLKNNYVRDTHPQEDGTNQHICSDVTEAQSAHHQFREGLLQFPAGHTSRAGQLLLLVASLYDKLPLSGSVYVRSVLLLVRSSRMLRTLSYNAHLDT